MDDVRLSGGAKLQRQIKDSVASRRELRHELLRALEPEAPIDVKAELEKLRIAEIARNDAETRMNALLKEMGYVG